MNACERLPERQILMNRTPIYLALLSALLVGVVRAEDARKATFWPDNGRSGNGTWSLRWTAGPWSVSTC